MDNKDEKNEKNVEVKQFRLIANATIYPIHVTVFLLLACRTQ